MDLATLKVIVNVLYSHRNSAENYMARLLATIKVIVTYFLLDSHKNSIWAFGYLQSHSYSLR